MKTRTFAARCALLVFGAGAAVLPAQEDAFTVSARMSASVVRARTMLESGQSDKARALLDSLVSAAPRGSHDAAEALHWRAQLSESEALAERDWKQLIVEIPLAPRAAEALLRIAELDRIRGNHLQVRQRVERILTDHPESPQRLHALMVLARSYFDHRNAPRACGVLEVARRDAPLGATELRLQADELQQQCRGVVIVAMGTPNDSTALTAASANEVAANAGQPPAVTNTPVASGNASNSTKPPAAPSTESANRSTAAAVWTVQVAAFNTRAQATALVNRLSKRSITGRVVGDAKPFRVHVGRFATRAQASAHLASLKTKGQSGFVAEIPAPPRPRPRTP